MTNYDDEIPTRSVIQIRIDSDEKDRWIRQARQEGMTLTSYIVRCVEADLEEYVSTTKQAYNAGPVVGIPPAPRLPDVPADRTPIDHFKPDPK